MFYRLKSYLFHFSILLVVTARLYQISSWGFDLLSFHDQTRNSFYANKKEPRVRTRFPLAEPKGFTPPSKHVWTTQYFALLRRPSGTPTKNNTNIAQTAIFSPFSLNTRLKYNAVRLLSYFSKIIVNNTIWVDASLTL